MKKTKSKGAQAGNLMPMHKQMAMGQGMSQAAIAPKGMKSGGRAKGSSQTSKGMKFKVV